MVKKICVAFNDSTAEALEQYETKYNCNNLPEAIKQIVNLYLVQEEEQ